MSEEPAVYEVNEIEVLRKRIKRIVTEECHQRNISAEHIETACEHALYTFEETSDFSSSILSGVRVAEGQQKRTVYWNGGGWGC